MSDDDDWGDDDDGWGDDADGDNEEWDNDGGFDEFMAEADQGMKLSPLEAQFEDADSLMSMRRKPEALEAFEKYLKMSEADNHPNSDQHLEALSKTVQLCVDLEKPKQSVEYYKVMLDVLDSGSHGQNDKKSAITDVLSQFDLGRTQVAEDFYILTIDKIKNDERLWFDFSIELGHAYLTMRQWKKLDPVLDRLHQACRKDGADDTDKADRLIQIYALKIEKMFATGDTKELDVIYQRTKKLSANVGDHRSAPILAEFNGKYHAEQRNYDKSYAEFFQAIKYADPDRGKLCVKYLVCVTMLGQDIADPFASREVKIYESDPTVAPMVSLYQYFLENQIYKFDALFKREEKSLCSDNFIGKLLPQIQVKLRKKTLVSILRPYQRVKLQWLADQLYYDMPTTEKLLIGMILDETILARINQVAQTLEIRKSKNHAVNNCLKGWMAALALRQQNLAAQIGRLDVGLRGQMEAHYMTS